MSYVREILMDADVTVLEHSRESFLAGLDLYEHRLDKQYSGVDCIAMQAMRRLGLLDALTADHHYVQEGFVALLRDPSI